MKSQRRRPENPRPGMPGMDRRHIRRFVALELIKHLFGIFVALLCTYAITSTLFHFIGSPPKVVEFIVGACAGFTLFFFLSVFRIKYMRLKHMKHMKHTHMDHMDRPNPLEVHRNFFDDLYDALDSIAQGDFSVFLESPEFGNRKDFQELASRVNNMAKELQGMENMRCEFISNVSHEIQSPLTSIMGFAALLKNPNLSWEEQLSYIEIIETESRRLSNLSDNLLRLSALDAGVTPPQKTSYSLDKQLKDIILSMEPQWAGKDIGLSIDTSPVVVQADKDLLSQVFINLLSNAVKFTPEGGEINVATALSDGGKQVSITVSDNGPGISPEDQKHIFERFFMADKSRKRDHGGNGLGLSIASKIVHMHDGSIRVESKPGQGATFIVTLPTASRPGESPSPEGEKVGEGEPAA